MGTLLDRIRFHLACLRQWRCPLCHRAAIAGVEIQQEDGTPLALVCRHCAALFPTTTNKDTPC